MVRQVVTLGHETRQITPGFLVDPQAAANLIDLSLVGTRLRIHCEVGVIQLQRRIEQCLGVENPVELRGFFPTPVRRYFINQRSELLGRALESQPKLLEQADGPKGVVGHPFRRSRLVLRLNDIGTLLCPDRGHDQPIGLIRRQFQPTAQPQHPAHALKAIVGTVYKFARTVDRCSQVHCLGITIIDEHRPKNLGGFCNHHAYRKVSR
ncbi:hypothetical protein D3C87_1286250 [compost metagenome]